MSHLIVGLDIGTHAVKALTVRSQMRSHEVVSYDEEPLHSGLRDDELLHEDAAEGAPRGDQADDGDEPHALSAAVRRALTELRLRGSLEGDVVVIGYPLTRCVQTRITLPFQERRRIEAVLPMQIEDRFPVRLPELITDFEARPNSDSPGTHHVAVVGALHTPLREYLAELAEMGVDPRVVEVRPARLLAATHMISPEATGTVALLDIGHETTDVCIVEGQTIQLLRTLEMGGADFTDALSRTFGLDPETAERGKHAEAGVELGPVPDSPRTDRERSQAVCRAVATELAGELNRTFHAHLAAGGSAVDQILICGGGSLLNGLPRFLALALGLPVDYLSVPEARRVDPAAGVRAVGAFGLAVRGLNQQPASTFNLRRGPLAFRGDFEFLRARARTLGVAVVLIVIALGFVLYAKRTLIQAQEAAYSEALCAATAQVFGEPCMRAPGMVRSQLTRIREHGSLIPEVSASELFRDISQALVDIREYEEIPVEVERLEIDVQRDIIRLFGSTERAPNIDVIVAELEHLDCLNNVAQQRTTQDRGTLEYNFELSADNICD